MLQITVIGTACQVALCVQVMHVGSLVTADFEQDL